MDIVKVTPSRPAPVATTPAKKSKKEKWQAYVDDALLRTGQVSQAAMFGLEGPRPGTFRLVLPLGTLCLVSNPVSPLYTYPSSSLFGLIEYPAEVE